MKKLKMLFSKDMFVGIMNLIFKYIPMLLAAKLFPCKEKDLWIVSERRNEAQDNGYWLFKYIREVHPDQAVCYAIDLKSSAAEKVKKLGPCVQYGSYKHYYYYFSATRLASTDFGIGAPNLFASLIARRLGKFFTPKAKRVFLQHGITKDRLQHAFKNKLQADLFICGAWPEYEYVASEFGYAPNEVKYTGFCRYDNLLNGQTKRKILYMPTWRSWMQPNGTGAAEARETFIQSTQYQKFKEFIESDEVKDLLEKYDFELSFLPHPKLQKYIDLFQSTSPRIQIIDTRERDIQDVLKESDVLITDYSSIYFDFAYMMKPVIYYQFDYEEYRKNQYGEGYFSYLNDGFGPVVYEKDALVEQLNAILDRDCKMEQMYAARTERFFKYRDKNNCQRNYEAIKQL